MPELTCTCPHCSQELNIDSEYSGQAVACPSCSGEFTVPTAPTSPAPAVAPAPRLNVPAAPQLQRPPTGPPPQQQAQPQQNPYQPPLSNPGGPQYGNPGMGGPSPHGVQHFLNTKPWITMFAVLASITPAIMLIMGVFIGFVGASAGEAKSAMITGVMLIAVGAIYFLPAWRLWQFSSAIGKLRFAPTHQALDTAIDRQRCFWKTVGIITLCAFALWVAAFVISISVLKSVEVDSGELFIGE